MMTTLRQVKLSEQKRMMVMWQLNKFLLVSNLIETQQTNTYPRDVDLDKILVLVFNFLLKPDVQSARFTRIKRYMKIFRTCTHSARTRARARTHTHTENTHVIRKV